MCHRGFAALATDGRGAIAMFFAVIASSASNSTTPLLLSALTGNSATYVVRVL
jgi:hypothetical protein